MSIWLIMDTILVSIHGTVSTTPTLEKSFVTWAASLSKALARRSRNSGLRLVPLFAPVIECRICSFKNVNGKLVYIVVFDRPGRIIDPVTVRLVDSAVNDLVSITVH